MVGIPDKGGGDVWVFCKTFETMTDPQKPIKIPKSQKPIKIKGAVQQWLTHRNITTQGMCHLGAALELN